MCAEATDVPGRKPGRHWLKCFLGGLAVMVLLVIVILLATHSSRSVPAIPDAPPPELSMSIDGDSRQLVSTQVVPTLDTPVESGKNVIWCASFVAAWKRLQNDVAGGPVTLVGAEDTCAKLNAASDPTGYIPEGSLYAAAGWVDKGIIETIATEMGARFPGEKAPEFPGAVPGDVVAFAHMEANVPFTIPYFENREPLLFRNGDETSTPVHSFGIREEDSGEHRKLRKQARVLYVEDPGSGPETYASDFAIDLCADSGPSQIIVAHTERQATLAGNVALVDEHIASWSQYLQEVSLTDMLLIPDMLWHLSHHYSEVEGKTFYNSGAIDSLPLLAALQSITFRLDRSGAEIKSEAKLHVGSGPIYYILDRPFIVIMKKRGAAEPYFVMWVDNAELLQKW